MQVRLGPLGFHLVSGLVIELIASLLAMYTVPTYAVKRESVSLSVGRWDFAEGVSQGFAVTLGPRQGGVRLT